MCAVIKLLQKVQFTQKSYLVTCNLVNETHYYPRLKTFFTVMKNSVIIKHMKNICVVILMWHENPCYNEKQFIQLLKTKTYMPVFLTIVFC